MDAGPLRHRITIQERVESRDTFGSVVWTWADWKDVSASIEPIAGREFFAAQQQQSVVDTRIRIRYREGVRTKMRVRYRVESGSPSIYRYYEIQNVIHVKEARRETHLMCVARESHGFRA